jgi:hypothetical protein
MKTEMQGSSKYYSTTHVESNVLGGGVPIYPVCTLCNFSTLFSSSFINQNAII